MPTLIDRTLSVGLLHAAASELLIRRAMTMHELSRKKLNNEAKQAFEQFDKEYKNFICCYKGLLEAQEKQASDIDCMEIEKKLNAEYKRITRLFERAQESQGIRLRHEAKIALNDFNESYKRFSISYERVQGIATDKRINEDTAQLFDAFLNDSGTLAMISMLYFNATNESNPQWVNNSKDILNVLRNLTLATTDPIFSLEYINQFAPKL